MFHVVHFSFGLILFSISFREPLTELQCEDTHGQYGRRLQGARAFA